jgi:hypothetical protein
VRFVQKQKKIPAPIPAITARAPINLPNMGPTGVDFLDTGVGDMVGVDVVYEPIGVEEEVEEDDDVEVEDEVKAEVEVLLEVVVDVEFSLIIEPDTDSVVDLDDETVPMTVEYARPTWPV